MLHQSPFSIEGTAADRSGLEQTPRHSTAPFGVLRAPGWCSRQPAAWSASGLLAVWVRRAKSLRTARTPS